MLCTLLAASALGQPVPTAADFFPLTPGTRWTYRETIEGTRRTYVDEAGEPVAIGERSATPIVTKRGTALIGTTFYAIAGDRIEIVAEEDARNVLAPPRPLFEVGADERKWTFDGTVPYNLRMVPIKIEGRSKRGGPREFDGKPVATLSVTISAVIKIGRRDNITQNQEAVYGAGIGLLEMRQKGKTKQGESSTELELVEFKPGGMANE